MNIPKLIKEAHDNAVERGFYDCPECHGKPIKMGDLDMSHGGMSCEITECKSCNGSGIDQNKNIGELLMLIVSELGEALEAHRCNRSANPQMYEIEEYANHIGNSRDDFTEDGFKLEIKDTFEDEIADVFIRLFDLCGYLKIDTQGEWFFYGYEAITDISENVPSELLNVTEHIIDIKKESDDLTSSAFVCNIGFCFAQLNCFCNKFNIPIEKYIKVKMAYNRIRPHRHGKEY